jgi:hypothetical protein
MKIPAYRLHGICNSVYEDSSSDEEPAVCAKNDAVDIEQHDEEDQDCNVASVVVMSNSNKPDCKTTHAHKDVAYTANFRPSHTALCVVLEHVKSIVEDKLDDEFVASTLCGNVLTETANRLDAFLSRAKMESVKSLRLSHIASYTIVGRQTKSDGQIDMLTNKQINGKYVYVVDLVYNDNNRHRLFFEKAKAMYTVASWIRVVTFDNDIRAQNISMDDVHIRSKVVRHICFDFLQCVRQALYTLQISTGSIRKEQLFLSGDTYMDTLMYYTPLSDTRVHAGGFSKYPLIMYPLKPHTGKRKRGQLPPKKLY